MAFLAKQFMSLLLLLIISRLILSTHAGRLFSQYGRTTTTTTNQNDQNTNNYQEFTAAEEQPAFVTDQLGGPNGLGASPSFRPLNYDPKMYTTSRETQKNMYNPKKEEPVTVAERFGAYNSFSNSKLDEQQQNDENKEEMPSTYNYKDSNQFQQRAQTQKQETKQYDPSVSQKYSKTNYFYNKNNDQVPTTNPFYDNNYSKKFNEQYDPSASQKYIESNEFYSKNNDDVPTKNPFYDNNYNKFNQEQNGEKYISGTPTAYQFGNKEDKNHNKFGKTSAAEYKTWYSKANQESIEEEEDAMEEDPLDAEEEGKNNLPNKFYSNSKFDETTTTVPDKYATFANVKDEPKPKTNAKYSANEDPELDALLDEQDEHKYGQSSTPVYKYSKNSPPYTESNNDRKAWIEKQNQEKQEKDNDKHFAYTDAELNDLLDEEKKQDEDEPAYHQPQGMSDTRWKSNNQYYQPTYNWRDHAKEFANAFSGNALENAIRDP